MAPEEANEVVDLAIAEHVCDDGELGGWTHAEQRLRECKTCFRLALEYCLPELMVEYPFKRSHLDAELLRDWPDAELHVPVVRTVDLMHELGLLLRKDHFGAVSAALFAARIIDMDSFPTERVALECGWSLETPWASSQPARVSLLPRTQDSEVNVSVVCLLAPSVKDVVVSPLSFRLDHVDAPSAIIGNLPITSKPILDYCPRKYRLAHLRMKELERYWRPCIRSSRT